MEIGELEIIPVAHREPPLRNSWGAHSELAARTIVRVESADGLVGVSETYGDGSNIGNLEGAANLVEGMNAYERTQVRLRLQDDIAFGAIEQPSWTWSEERPANRCTHYSAERSEIRSSTRPIFLQVSGHRARGRGDRSV